MDEVTAASTSRWSPRPSSRVMGSGRRAWGAAARQAEVADLRAAGRYREARPTEIRVESVSMTSDDSATAETVEQWDDRTYAPNRSLLRDASGTLRQHYELRRLDGQWKIVEATIVRADHPSDEQPG